MKQSDKMYKYISNIITKLSGEMTDARLEELVNERFGVCSKMVQALTSTDVSDIPIHYGEAGQTNTNTGELLALYRCSTLQPPFKFIRRYNGGDEIIMVKATIKKLWQNYCRFSERRFKIAIDSILAHELFHAVDARTNSSIFTNIELFDFGLSQIEMYTDWRAYRALSNTVYKEVKGADEILRKYTRLTREDVIAFNKAIPANQTYTAPLVTVENAVKRKFIFFGIS